MRSTQEHLVLGGELARSISTAKRALRPYFMFLTRQMCSEFRCSEEKEAPEKLEEEEEVEEGVGEEVLGR